MLSSGYGRAHQVTVLSWCGTYQICQPGLSSSSSVLTLIEFRQVTGHDFLSAAGCGVRAGGVLPSGGGTYVALRTSRISPGSLVMTA